MKATTLGKTQKSRISLAHPGRVGVAGECIFQVWPIRAEEDYLKAIKTVNALSIKEEDSLTGEERDQLEIFSILIEKYEADHYQIEPLRLTPVQFLEILMRESGMNASGLGKLLGDRSLGHKILTGDRGLSKKHIKILSDYFKVDASAFLS